MPTTTATTTKGVLFWARQALKVNNSSSQTKWKVNKLAEHMNMQWMHGQDDVLALTGLRVVAGSPLSERCEEDRVQWSHFLPSRSNRGITWLDCLHSRHRTWNIYGACHPHAGLLSDVLIWNAFEHVATLMAPQSAIRHRHPGLAACHAI